MGEKSKKFILLFSISDILFGGKEIRGKDA